MSLWQVWNGFDFQGDCLGHLVSGLAVLFFVEEGFDWVYAVCCTVHFLLVLQHAYNHSCFFFVLGDHLMVPCCLFFVLFVSPSRSLPAVS